MPGIPVSRNSLEYETQNQFPIPKSRNAVSNFPSRNFQPGIKKGNANILYSFAHFFCEIDSWYPWQLPLYYLVKVKNQFKTGILQKVRVRDHCMFSSQMAALLSNNEILFESYHTKLFLYYSRSRFPPFPGIAAKISLPVGKFHFTSRKTGIFLIPVLFYQGW